MLPGEAPLAFFLRTSANEETRQLAEEARAAENRRKDAHWLRNSKSRIDFLLPHVSVKEVSGRGRGLVTNEPIAAGTVVLRERALAAVPLAVDYDADQPILETTRLAMAVLASGCETATRALEPRLGREFAEHPVRAASTAELVCGRKKVREGCFKMATFLDDEAIDRLILAVCINALDVLLPDGQIHQGMFPELGAMLNHSCRPNLLIHGIGIAAEDSGHDQLQLVAQAVRDVDAGEELTVTYLGELYLPYPEREDSLRDRYGFAAERLTTDIGLESMLNKEPAQKAADTKRVVAANSAASEAWETSEAISKMKIDKPEAIAEMRRQQMIAASNYAALLNTNLLSETHSWRYNASCRLASVLTRDGSEKSSKQALMLWESTIRSGLKVWPSAHWPEHRKLLRGAKQAAIGANDQERAAKYSDELERIEKAMTLANNS